VPGEIRETPSEIAAKCLAAAMAATKAGAVALARMADDEPVILGRYGEVAEEMLVSSDRDLGRSRGTSVAATLLQSGIDVPSRPSSIQVRLAASGTGSGRSLESTAF
jgi:hypothetical protein